jgi:hypothetical protein
LYRVGTNIGAKEVADKGPEVPYATPNIGEDLALHTTLLKRFPDHPIDACVAYPSAQAGASEHIDVSVIIEENH